MDKLLEDRLYECILLENRESILSLIQQGANPNKITSHGKTCLGEAAYLGNISIVQQLIDACKSNYPQNRNFTQSYSKKRHVKTHKRKLKSLSQDDTVIKCKNPHDRVLKCNPVSESTSVLQDNQKCEKNQGYFVFIHSEGSSSDESKMCSLKSPVSPSSQVSSPQAELEWDEETADVAPTTSEDETWSSMYKWYAAILECTGAAIASASVVTNGIDQQDAFMRTALHYAVEQGHTQVVNLVIDAVTNGIDQQDAFMRTALHYAVEQGHTQVVNLVIDAGCKVDIVAGDGLTSLHIAVMKNHAEIVRQLISAGSHVNYKTHEKMTPLHFAASRGFLELVIILVNNGAYLEARDTSERTALYLAAGRGHIDVVRYLISVGANVNGEEIHGYTPLCEAVWQRYTKVVEVLLLSGARITHSHKLLHNAIIQRQEEIVRMLANMGGGINLHNDNGDTPLLLAVRLSQPTIAQILLQKGGNINSCNNITGASALHIAVESIDCPKEFEELLVCFLKYKIDMNSTALTGDTALNRALLLQKDHAAVLLIRHGADVNACDLHSCGLDNLSISSRRRSTHLANLLLKSGHHRPLPDSNSTSKCTTSLWIQDICKQPQTLLDMCRIRIRSICKNKPLYCYINYLPLPKSLKRFLMLEDEGYTDVCISNQ